MNKGMKNVALILLIVVLVMLFYQAVQKGSPKIEEVSYSQFKRLVEERKVITKMQEPLIIQGQKILGQYTNRKDSNQKNEDSLKQFESYIPYQDPELLDFLTRNQVRYKGSPVEENIFWNSILAILPWIIGLGFIWFLMMRQLQSTGNRAMSFGRSRAKMHPDMKNKVTFKDVAGVEEAKGELAEVVDFLKDPQKFHTIGAKIPRGVLLVGPPGTGKTLLSRAVAGEAGVPFFSISGSDFVEMFVGVGASRVRDLFNQAKKNVPCIVFIDEIDAVGRLRGAGLGGGHDEREQTLNQLLVEMDGFEENQGVIVIAATNRADVLDPALLRPGRFDRQVVVDAPDVRGREEILKIHARKVPLKPGTKMDLVAKGTPGFTGADLANLVNEAALLAARRGKKNVTESELDEARDKVLMGPERRSFLIGVEEKKIIAYHEAGHAIIGEMTEYGEPIHKVTIVPRGRALGLTQYLPQEERHMRSKNFWMDQIAILLGGRLAEEIIFEDVTTGASNDIERATDIARRMVTEWGMSNKIGPIRLSGSGSNAVFLGRDYGKSSDHSDEYSRRVDEEVKSIIDTQMSRARKMLKSARKTMDETADLLLEKEVITGDELRSILAKNSKSSTRKAGSKEGGKSGKASKPSTSKKGKSKKSDIVPDLGGGVQPA